MVPATGSTRLSVVSGSLICGSWAADNSQALPKWLSPWQKRPLGRDNMHVASAGGACARW